MAHSSDPSHREKTPGTQGSNSATRNLLRKKEQRRRGIRSSSPMGRVILINSPVDGEEWVGGKGVEPPTIAQGSGRDLDTQTVSCYIQRIYKCTIVTVNKGEFP